jgi:hypothetical protein
MHMKTMHRNRLLKLAAFLRKLPRERFNYGLWVGHSWEGNPDLSCGTSACAFGWATTIPSLRASGLRLVRRNDFDYGQPGWRNPKTGRTTIGYERASREVFGLSADEAHHLFIPSWPLGSEASPQQVADHIVGFVESEARRA